MPETVRFWYVSAQRLCNFKCPGCVSVNDYAKSNSTDWLEPEDQQRFQKIVEWVASRPFPVGIRLATLGEPFASEFFLQQAAWLTRQPNIEFVELVTNGSLLKRRLGKLDRDGDISKVSLWVTHHHTEISIDRFIGNVRHAQDTYGCFAVVNGLLFPDNEDSVAALKNAADDAGLRFNLDLGYDPLTPHGVHTDLRVMIPILGHRPDAISRAVELGASSELMDLNMTAMRDLRGERCGAGDRYFYIGIRGDVYRCSRYQALGKEPLGNILEGTAEISPSSPRWLACEAGFGCGNKEDFLNLKRRVPHAGESVPSLGWTGPRVHNTSRPAAEPVPIPATAQG